eukprot:m.106349 g.106349  ORF g.106349 m.106349 type:complete len:53 (+) comp16895_c0_seq1:621-779(+)
MTENIFAAIIWFYETKSSLIPAGSNPFRASTTTISWGAATAISPYFGSVAIV